MSVTLGKRPSLIVAHLAVVLAVLVGGVASAIWLPTQTAGASGAEARTLVAQAATRITALGSYRMSFEFVVEAKRGQKIESTGTGLVDLTNNVQSGKFEVPGAGTIEFRQVGTRSYVRLPGDRTDVAGHHWIGIPVANSAALGAQDPMQFLRAIGGDAEVENKGPEEVGGVPTVRYAMKLDVQRLIEEGMAQGAVSGPIPAGLADQFDDAKVDLWLDEENLPRRMRMSLGTDDVSVRFQFEFADYGGTIQVEAPAAADVTQAANLQQGMQMLQAAFRP